jgi:hypothetical protein
MRGSYKILSEIYSGLSGVEYTPDITVRQVPFSEDEMKVLTAIYDFQKIKTDPLRLARIVAAGEVEDVAKFSDNTYVRMTDEARGVTKHTYKSFFEMTKMLRNEYKANREADLKQNPKGKSMPSGSDLIPGGQ